MNITPGAASPGAANLCKPCHCKPCHCKPCRPCSPTSRTTCKCSQSRRAQVLLHSVSSLSLSPLSLLSLSHTLSLPLSLQESNTNKTHRGIIHSLRATGNNVSHSRRHTRRTFMPNVFWRKLYSETCGKMMGPMWVSATGLRDVDKCGGLDNYVKKNPYKRTQWEGQMKRVRDEILTRQKIIDKFGKYMPREKREASQV